ncbi:MAG: universal stress protein [Spirochaetales bacterium]|jgi:nucleotide-binding universal stress UspA family protein|nr:universal stress protein [Spirochaetales bacterium]
MLKQIVIGIDGSNESMAAFEQALSLAKQVGCDLKCVFIIDLRKTQMPFIYTGAAYEGAYERLYIPPDSSMRKFYEKIAGDLDDFAGKCIQSCKQRAEKAGVEFESIVKSGYPGMELCDEGRSGGLLVVGQRGENAHYKRSIVGSITEDLMRISPRPLMICPDSVRDIKTVITPYDGSRSSEHALQYYVNGLRNPADKFIFLVVGDEVQDEHQIEEELKYLEQHDVPVSLIRRKGGPAKEILSAAREESADLILLGAHGRNRLRDIFIGSTASHVIHKSEVPVLLVF